jgi:hypothetical protein
MSEYLAWKATRPGPPSWLVYWDNGKYELGYAMLKAAIERHPDGKELGTISTSRPMTRQMRKMCSGSSSAYIPLMPVKFCAASWPRKLPATRREQTSNAAWK